MPKRRQCAWRANRRFFPHVTSEMWQWFESWIGGDGITMRVLVLAGGRHARKMAQAILDLEKLKEAGFPVKLDLVAVCCEDPRTEEGCAYWNAHERFYWSCASQRPSDRTPGALGGRWIRDYVTSTERWKAKESIDSFVFHYGDPCDPEFQAQVDLEGQIRRIRGLSSDERLFHLCVCLPWGRWIGPWVREKCGEAVVLEDGQPKLVDGKRQLLKVADAKWSHGFVCGLHPFYDCGGAVAAEALQGADPLERILDSYLEVHSSGFDVKSVRARLGVYGIGPWKMDDGRLFAHAGPPGKLCAWPFAGRKRPIDRHDIAEEDWHTALRQMVEGTKELIPKTLVVRRGRDGYGLADAIANQVWVLYQAHTGNPPRRSPS